jgi:hypothetical protein
VQNFFVVTAKREFKLKTKNPGWGGARRGAGRKSSPVAVITGVPDVWPTTELVEASPATVEALAKCHTRDAVETLNHIAQRGRTEGLRVLAASKLLDVAERLGVLRRSRRH